MDFSGYRGRRVVVTGCSSGIGEATARALVGLGAEVVGADIRTPTVKLAAFHHVDLADPDSIVSSTSDIGGRVDALFNCAGLIPMAPPVDILKVNYLGTRLFTERVLDLMTDGGAVVSVSSDGGFGWRSKLPLLIDLVSVDDFEAGLAWYAEHEPAAGHPYSLGKEALVVWTLVQSAALVPRGVRINTTSPGAVQTPMLDAIAAAFPPEMVAAPEHPSGRRSTAAEQVGPLLFLNSDLASYVNGADLAVDGGYSAHLSVAQQLTRTGGQR
jgi:NAD(P)-dependent dehydrogenase (short-subunit alcohol dehydrogenase family)